MVQKHFRPGVGEGCHRHIFQRGYADGYCLPGNRLHLVRTGGQAIELAKKLAATFDQVVAAHKTYGLSVFIRELSQPNTGLGRATLVLQPLAPPNEIG